MHAHTAIDHGILMVEQGAAIIDVGGESARPGATRIGADEQIRRVLPVIQGLHRNTNAMISIDTTLADVARAAIDAGATMVNDVSAGTEDATLLQHVASSNAHLVLMHRLVPPDQDHYSNAYAKPPVYPDVVAAVIAHLHQCVDNAMRAGVQRSRILVDPGFGFGKTVEHNLELLRRLSEVVAMGAPVLVGFSRKSFLSPHESDPAQRLPATLIAAMQAMQQGAAVVRVHDVAPHMQARANFLAARAC